MTYETRPARDLLSIPYLAVETYKPRYDDDTELIVLPYTTYGDYIGSTVERSNHDAILDDFADEVTSKYLGHGAYRLVVEADGEISAALYDSIESLRDYPLYSEDHHSYLESDIEDEDWRLYGRDEVRSQVENHARPLAEDDEDEDRFREYLDDALTDDVIDAAYGDARSYGSVTWESESATGGYFRGLDSLGQEIAKRLYDDYLRHERGDLPEWRCPGQIPLDIAV